MASNIAKQTRLRLLFPKSLVLLGAGVLLYSHILTIQVCAGSSFQPKSAQAFATPTTKFKVPLHKDDTSDRITDSIKKLEPNVQAFKQTIDEGCLDSNVCTFSAANFVKNRTMTSPNFQASMHSERRDQCQPHFHLFECLRESTGTPCSKFSSSRTAGEWPDGDSECFLRNNQEYVEEALATEDNIPPSTDFRASFFVGLEVTVSSVQAGSQSLEPLSYQWLIVLGVPTHVLDVEAFAAHYATKFVLYVSSTLHQPLPESDQGISLLARAIAEKINGYRPEMEVLWPLAVHFYEVEWRLLQEYGYRYWKERSVRLRMSSSLSKVYKMTLPSSDWTSHEADREQRTCSLLDEKHRTSEEETLNVCAFGVDPLVALFWLGLRHHEEFRGLGTTNLNVHIVKLRASGIDTREQQWQTYQDRAYLILEQMRRQDDAKSRSSLALYDLDPQQLLLNPDLEQVLKKASVQNRENKTSPFGCDIVHLNGKNLGKHVFDIAHHSARLLLTSARRRFKKSWKQRKAPNCNEILGEYSDEADEADFLSDFNNYTLNHTSFLLEGLEIPEVHNVWETTRSRWYLYEKFRATADIRRGQAPFWDDQTISIGSIQSFELALACPISLICRDLDFFECAQSIPHRRRQWQEFMDMHSKKDHKPGPPAQYLDWQPGTKGVVLTGGQKHIKNLALAIAMLRDTGCALPVEVWHDAELTEAQCKFLTGISEHIACKSMEQQVTNLAKKLISVRNEKDGLRGEPIESDLRLLYANLTVNGFQKKIPAIALSSFQHVIFLDADNIPVRDVTHLLQDSDYERLGAMFWPDYWRWDSVEVYGATAKWNHAIWWVLGLHEEYQISNPAYTQEQEAGLLVLDKGRVSRELQLALFLNGHMGYYGKLLYGDKDMFRLSWLALKTPFAYGPQPSTIGVTARQSGATTYLQPPLRALDNPSTVDKEGMNDSTYRFAIFSILHYERGDNGQPHRPLCIHQYRQRKFEDLFADAAADLENEYETPCVMWNAVFHCVDHKLFPDVNTCGREGFFNSFKLSDTSSTTGKPLVELIHLLGDDLEWAKKRVRHWARAIHKSAPA